MTTQDTNENIPEECIVQRPPAGDIGVVALERNATCITENVIIRESQSNSRYLVLGDDYERPTSDYDTPWKTAGRPCAETGGREYGWWCDEVGLIYLG
jgi:hypothetical protein